MKSWGVVILVFGVLGPLILPIYSSLVSLISGEGLPESSTDLKLMTILAFYFVGLVPALVTGSVCAVIFSSSWTLKRKRNLLIVALIVSMFGFVFSYTASVLIFSGGLAGIGVIGAVSAFVCALFSGVLLYGRHRGR